ncbi:MAG: hypothetical protein H6737_23285 [Alphaproteobacteria bacterium]|nr:hypothetical protein [Alphaproteobacteria bacterium]
MPERLPLGDLLRALDALSATHAEAAVAAVLGYQLRSQPRPGPGGGSSETDEQPSPEKRPRTRNVVPEARPATAVPLVAQPVDRIVVDAWKPPRERMGRPSQASGAPPPVPGLLPSPTLRASLSAIAARPVPDGPIDVDRLVEKLVHHPPLEALPRRTKASTRPGVQVLVDTSDGMMPYEADQQRFVADLLRIVPAHRVQVVQVHGDPLHEEVGIGDRFGPWPRPREGQAVVLLSDLGLGPRGRSALSPRAWVSLLKAIREAGSVPVALLPVPARLWPAHLRALCRMVYWSEATRASDVVRSMRGLR